MNNWLYLSLLITLLTSSYARADQKQDSLNQVQIIVKALKEENITALKQMLEKQIMPGNVYLLEKSISTPNNSYGKSFVAQCRFLLGIVYTDLSEFTKATNNLNLAKTYYESIKDSSKILECKFESVEIKLSEGLIDQDILILQEAYHFFAKTNNVKNMFRALHYLSFASNQLGETDKTIRYLMDGAKLARQHNNCTWSFIFSNMLVDVYINIQNFDSASKYLDLAFNHLRGCKKGIALGRKGMLLVAKGRLKEKMKPNEDADSIYLQAKEIFNTTKMYSWYAYLFSVRAEYYYNRQLFKQAANLAMEGYSFSKAKGLPKEVKDNLGVLYLAYEKLGDFEKAYRYGTMYWEAKDSLITRKGSQAMKEMDMKLIAEKNRFNNDLKHQQQLTKEKNRKNLFMAIGLFVLILAGGLWSRLRYAKRAGKIIEKAKQRSDELLLNILPAEIAEELKLNGVSEARNYDMATILFTDFKEFTQTAEKMHATDLVHELDHCFKAFDGICEKYQIEKIKTIGDAYMAAAGLPVPKDLTARDAVLAGLEMAEFMKMRNREREKGGIAGFEMRIGIHTGPVVAGIVGLKKFQYDIWGDTVNIASRMESSGEVGEVNISKVTYERIKNDEQFAFETRGKIEVKGKGEMEMWFVRRS